MFWDRRCGIIHGGNEVPVQRRFNVKKRRIGVSAPHMNQDSYSLSWRFADILLRALAAPW